LFDDAQAALTDHFRSVSGEVLAGAQEQLALSAAARLGGAQQAARLELDARKDAVATMVAQMQQSLDAVAAQTKALEQARTESYAALRTQVGQLRDSDAELRRETGRIATALRSTSARGRWGEVQLHRLVEAAGMLEHVDYLEQVTGTASNGAAVRPDLVVRLPEGRCLAVDSKVPLDHWLRAVDAEDPAEVAAAVAAQAKALRTQVKSLSDKGYQSAIGDSPDFVVLFVPTDAFLHDVLAADPGLLEDAFGRNVVIATPSTLLALLKTVALSWRTEAVSRNAADVLAAGRELHDRMATFTGHLSKVGKAISSASAAFNSAVGSLEGRVFPSLRRMEGLQAVAAKDEVAVPGLVEVGVRQVAIRGADDRQTESAA
jgi:DNA recombination protein RmuC